MNIKTSKTTKNTLTSQSTANSSQVTSYLLAFCISSRYISCRNSNSLIFVLILFTHSFLCTHLIHSPPTFHPPLIILCSSYLVTYFLLFSLSYLYCPHTHIFPYFHSLIFSGGYMPLAATLATTETFDAFLGKKKWHALLHGHSFTVRPTF